MALHLINLKDCFNKSPLLCASKRSTIPLRSLCFSLRRQFESAILIWQNEILTNDSIVAIWQFAVQSAREKHIAIVDAQDVRNWMLKLRVEANLNALEFRNFLINPIRDRVQTAICILNISCYIRQPRGMKCARCIFFLSGTSEMFLL